MKKTILLALLVCLLIPVLYADEDEFILGLWHCWNAGRIGGEYWPPDSTCSEADSMWVDSIIPPEHAVLIDSIHANRLQSFFYGYQDCYPILNYCNSRNGEIKIYLGIEGISNTSGFEQLGAFGKQAWNYNSTTWQTGLHNILEEYDQYIDSVGFGGFYIAEEWNWNDPHHDQDQYYGGFNAMIDSVRQHDSSHSTIMVWLSRRLEDSFTDSLTGLNIWEEDLYPFYWNTPFSGINFQNTIDWIYEQYSEDCWDRFEGTNTKWVALIQAFADYKDTLESHYTCDDNNYPHKEWRWPTREEIRLQAFMALACGARGVCVFSLSSQYYSKQATAGLLHWNHLDMLDPSSRENGNMNPWGDFDDYEGIPYEHVAELYGELETWGDYFLPLYVDEHYSRADDGNLPDSSQILRYVSGEYIAASTFTDTSRWEETRYFMIVNRVASDADAYGNPADPQVIDTITFRVPDSAMCIVKDMFFENYWYFTTPDSLVDGYAHYHFTDSIDAGDGKLYRIIPGRSGTICVDTEFYDRELIVGDLVIPDTVTIDIPEGAIFYFLPDQGIDISLNGAFEIAGSSSSRIKFTSLNELGDSAEAGDWNRIEIEADVEGSFEYCDFGYASYGIYLRDTSSVTVRQCTFENSHYSGIRNDRGQLTVDNCTFEDNNYGIISYYAQSDIDSSTFIDCKYYGVLAQGEPAYSLDSTFITNCYFRTGESSVLIGSLYGIRAHGIDDIRIENNYVRTYGQGGIYLYDSDGIVLENEVNLCSYFGIYSTNACNGLIHFCDFDSLYYGIYLSNSSANRVDTCNFDSVNVGIRIYGDQQPDLGEYADSNTAEWGFNDFENCGTYYIEQLASYNPGPLITAEMNYFGGTPDAGKFSGNIDYDPYLDDDPRPKLLPGGTLPLAYDLRGNYPNPFNPRTTLSFSLAEPGYTSIEIYNILGQRITSLINEFKPAGDYTIIWNSQDSNENQVASGIYFYRLVSGDYVDTKKMLLLR